MVSHKPCYRPKPIADAILFKVLKEIEADCAPMLIGITLLIFHRKYMLYPNSLPRSHILQCASFNFITQ